VNSQGDWPSRSVFDVTANSGSQQITITASGVREKVEFRLVDDVVYARGDSGGLQYELNLTETQADKYAGRWISIPKGDSLYQQAADGLTLASSLGDFIPDVYMSLHTCTGAESCLYGGWDFRPKTRPFLILDGSVSNDRSLADADETVSTRSRGARLPIGFDANSDPDLDIRGSFSKWNEPLHIEAPASATPIAIVRRVRTHVPAIRIAADLPPKTKTWPAYPHFSARSCWPQRMSPGLGRLYWAPSFAPRVPKTTSSPQQIAQRLLARFGDHRYIHGVRIGAAPRRFLGTKLTVPRDALWAYIAAPGAGIENGSVRNPTQKQQVDGAIANWEASLIFGALRDEFCAAGGRPLAGWSGGGTGDTSDSAYPFGQRFPNPKPAAFRRRLALIGRRYGFKIVSLRLLRPLQYAPLIVIATRRDPRAFDADLGAIASLVDPERPGDYTFEGSFIEARGARGAFGATYGALRGTAYGGGW